MELCRTGTIPSTGPLTGPSPSTGPLPSRPISPPPSPHLGSPHILTPAPQQGPLWEGVCTRQPPLTHFTSQDWPAEVGFGHWWVAGLLLAGSGSSLPFLSPALPCPHSTGQPGNSFDFFLTTPREPVLLDCLLPALLSPDFLSGRHT